MALKLALLGDVCLTGRFDLETNPQALRQFEHIQPMLERYDLVVANLESPLTDRPSSWVCKSIHIQSPPVNTRILQDLGVSAVSLANNHQFDYGREGYRSTLAALEQAGIGHFGTRGRMLRLERADERLLLGGFCCLSAHPSGANPEGVNLLNHRRLRQFLEVARRDGRFPIASVHWGDENTHYPRADHVRLARLLASEHAFVLHGHHPHVVQGLEQAGDSLVAYSLGNFCTDEHRSRSIRGMTVRHTPENRQSFVLGVTIENGTVLSHEVIPIMDDGDALVIQGEAAREAIRAYSSKLSAPYRRPSQEAHIAPPGNSAMPARFGLTWFLQRLNYHFIGAFLKGMLNRLRYQRYFAEIRRMASQRGL